MKKIKLIVFSIIILSLTLTACTPGQENPAVTDTIGQTPSTGETDKGDKTPNSDSSDQGDEATTYEDITLTFSDAFNIYTKKFPNTKVKKVELDTDYGVYVYEAEGYDGVKKYEIKIHPISGEVLKEEIEDDNNHHGELTIDHTDKVEEIIKMALSKAGENALIKEVTLKDKKGKIEIEVEIDKDGSGDIEYTYDINGTLIETD